MKRTRLRRQSSKARKRAAEAKPVRDELLAEVPWCEVCRFEWSELVHEIAQGADRQKALDQRYAVLVLGAECHRRIHTETGWPVARQLAALARSRPADYDLDAFNQLVGPGPKRVTEAEVRQWL